MAPLVLGRVPLWSLLALVAATAGLLPATRPLRDPDIWWHVRLGDLIQHEGVPRAELWSYPILGHAWHPTAWLSDVGLASLHDVAGWRGIVLFKLAASAAVLTLLYRQVLPQARAEISAVVYVVALGSVGIFFGERPQLISFIFVLIVAPWARRLALTGIWQPWHWVAITYVWCNLHGMWVLGPALLVLAAVSWTVQARGSIGSPRTLVLALLTSAAATAATALTPVGPRLTLQPLAVQAISPEISEWQPTSLTGNAPPAFALFLLLLVVSWAITRPPPGLLAFSLALIAFSFVAVRNIAPVSLVLAPILAESAGRAVGARLPASASTIPRSVAVAVAGVIVAGVVVLAFTRPATDPTLPWKIVDRLEGLPQPKHVVADYVVSGFLTGEAPSVSVAMDTRTDNYSRQFVHAYFDMLKMGPHWRRTLRTMDPDYAVLLSDSSLDDYLKRDRHWVVVLEDNGFELLRPPTSAPTD